MTSGVAVFDPRVDPEPAGWRDFQRRWRLHAVWDYELIRLEAWTARNPPVLIVVSDAGKVVAGLSVLVCRPWRKPRYASAPKQHSRWPRIRGPVWAEVYQPWLSGFPGVVFDPGLDPAARGDVARLAERELARCLGAGLLGVLYRALDQELAGIVAGRGRLTREVDSVAVLANDFSSPDDWLSLLSKSRRASLRRQHRELESASDLLVRGGAARDDLDGAEIARLINRHRAERGKAPLDTRSPLSGAYFERFLRRPDVHTLTYHDDEGQLLAVNTMLDHPDSVIKQHWAALPEAEGGRKHLFFDSYQRAVRHLVRRGAAELSAGRRPHEVKRSLGFRTRPIFGVAVPRPVVGR
ncbi:hypothetical protein SAMN05216266_107196 [Amycolatopsis marina]|uniref:BioF2-like acetyltransferase domain-containing protein n=1 Tax=Amycolatopsis marina TaxID=490629 RepID=A0A1I0ZRR3_9PSEU|nr:GNAT family N-acetyltransferase [Amycolatopsis marina]SFB27806.1 hypothetical protein SAMN05216266_107196 [Amycolatopsis marina]